MTRRQAIDRKRRNAKRAKARTRECVRFVGWGPPILFEIGFVQDEVVAMFRRYGVFSGSLGSVDS